MSGQPLSPSWRGVDLEAGRAAALDDGRQRHPAPVGGRVREGDDQPRQAALRGPGLSRRLGDRGRHVVDVQQPCGGVARQANGAHRRRPPRPPCSRSRAPDPCPARTARTPRPPAAAGSCLALAAGQHRGADRDRGALAHRPPLGGSESTTSPGGSQDLACSSDTSKPCLEELLGLVAVEREQRRQRVRLRPVGRHDAYGDRDHHQPDRDQRAGATRALGGAADRALERLAHQRVGVLGAADPLALLGQHLVDVRRRPRPRRSPAGRRAR